MAYQALYRRLRPQCFEDVIGQEHIIHTLKNQIENNLINHAYLFCGTRGTGKTTTAKIFARAINCEGEGVKPCNTCDLCKSALKGTSTNIIELDAASNNSVDDIRNIVDEVRYAPTEGRYRVYIIDEVHMLSTSAFNALLKTLEEPPSYVVFILATTDPQRLPVTVLSRCQRFDFHRIGHKAMVAALEEYMVNEGKQVEPEALDYIAEISDGAMRDALSILDQCLSFYYDSEITADKVREVVGAADRGVLFELTDAMNNNNAAKCMDIIDNLCIKGRDIQQLSSELLSHFRNLLLAGSVNEETASLDFSKDYITRLKQQAANIGFDYLIWLVREFSELINQMKYSSAPRILLEVGCIKACNPVTASSYGALTKRISDVESKLESGSFSVAVPQQAEVQQVEERQAEVQQEPVAIQKAVPEDIKAVIADWRGFIKSIRVKSALPATLSSNTEPRYLEDEVLTIVCKDNGSLVYLNNAIEKISEELKRYFQRDIKVRIMQEKEYNNRHKQKYGVKDTEIKPLTREVFAEKLKNVEFTDE